jgi:hypothetical protein
LHSHNCYSGKLKQLSQSLSARYKHTSFILNKEFDAFVIGRFHGVADKDLNYMGYEAVPTDN